MKITAIILTANEELHLLRCINSVKNLAQKILVVDSYSTDSTPDIAIQNGADFLQKKWINYSTQFNWALSKIDSDSDWVIRLDADEIISPQLSKQILEKIALVESNVDGIRFKRKIIFQGVEIKYGGLFPIKVVRMFRPLRGHCENRWMDEHIKVQGNIIEFDGYIIDENLNNITWWTDKHNKYASREAVDLLNLEFKFMDHDSVASLRGWKQAEIKRWVKEVIYAKLSIGFRSTAYFLYRYIMRLGFLDGQVGFSFHFLQGYWYRYLVDAKIKEVKRHAKQKNVCIKVAIFEVLGIKV